MARQSIQERFWSKVDKTKTCWLWKAFLFPNGYGGFRTGQRRIVAHRMSWLLTNGAIPDALKVLHRCDVRSCVNPAHLFLGTSAENTADMFRKGRWKMPAIKRGNATLTESDVKYIRSGNDPTAVLQAKFGISQQTVSAVRLRNTWKHV